LKRAIAEGANEQLHKINYTVSIQRPASN